MDEHLKGRNENSIKPTLGRRNMKRGSKWAGLLMVVAVYAGMIWRAFGADPVPYEFVNGEVADADQVNANFEHVVDELGLAEAQIDALETRVSDLETENEALQTSLAAVETQLASVSVTQFQGINTQSLTATDLSGEIRWSILSIQGVSAGDSVLQIADDAANTRTTFTALRDCVVSAYVEWNSSAGGNTANVRVNGSIVAVGNSDSDAATTLLAGAHVYLNAGDVLTFGASATADYYKIAITAIADVPLAEL